MAQSNTNTAESPPTASAETGKSFSRDEIRSAILDAKGEDEVIEVFGIKVEIRAPALEDLMQYRDAANDEFIMARAIVNNVYVPGTEQRVFDEADIPELMTKRLSKDLKKLNSTISRVLGGDEAILQAVDNDTKSNTE